MNRNMQSEAMESGSGPDDGSREFKHVSWCVSVTVRWRKKPTDSVTCEP